MLQNLQSNRPHRAKQFFRVGPIVFIFLILVIFFFIFASVYIYPKKIHGVGILLLQGELHQILSPVSGTLESWQKEEGDSILIGDEIAIIREHENQEITKKVIAKIKGILAEIIAYPNVAVHKGQAIAVVTNHGDLRTDLELVGFVSSLEGKKIKPHMKALIAPTITDSYQHGYLMASVKRVGRLPMTKEAVQSIVKIPEVAKYIRSKIDAEPYMVVLSPMRDEQHKTGYRWNGPGPDFVLDSGVFADIDVIYEEQSLLFLLWPTLRRWWEG